MAPEPAPARSRSRTALALASALLAAALASALLGACGGGSSKQTAEAPVVHVGSGARDEPKSADAPDEAPGAPSAAPRPRRFEGKLDAPLGLKVTVTDEGISIATNSGPVAPGCLRMGAGITVPMRGGAHDREALTACARRLKDARPEFASEDQVTVIASPDMQYRAVIELIDALRGDENEPLFPEVSFGALR
jgi:hypothetical protein